MLFDALSHNLMLLCGRYMKGARLKWRCLFFWYTLSRFDPIVIWITNLKKLSIVQASQCIVHTKREKYFNVTIRWLKTKLQHCNGMVISNI
jgi:hypothetical protein